MGFTLDDIVIDRVQYGYAEDFEGNPLYTLTQLQDATINITAESKDAVDNTGSLIKRFWQGKTGEFTANNAMINLNIIGVASGEGKKIATNEQTIDMPRIITVKKGEKPVLKDVVEGSVRVNAFNANGSMGKAYKKNTSASETDFSVDGGGNLGLPTDDEVNMFIVKYDRKVKSGVAISNKADKFPQTVKLTLKVLAVDPCHADTLKAAYVEMPSFQVSPEVEISLTTDGQLAYSGSLQVDYCAADKCLYRIYWADEDEEGETL